MCMKKLENLKTQIHEKREKQDDIYDSLAVKFQISNEVFIYINSEDKDPIPHFHYNRGSVFATLIRMDKEEYLGTSKRISYEEKSALQNFLEQPVQNPRYTGTNWEFLVMGWNMNNDIQLDEERKLDYRNLK